MTDMSEKNVDFRKDFADRLDQIMNELGWPKRGRTPRLIELLGISISEVAVRKWVEGIAYPETDKVILIAKKFNVSVDWLLTGSETSERERILSQQKLRSAIDRVLQLSVSPFLDLQIQNDLKMVGTELMRRIESKRSKG